MKNGTRPGQNHRHIEPQAYMLQMQAHTQNCKLNLILISNHRPHVQAKIQIIFLS